MLQITGFNQAGWKEKSRPVGRHPESCRGWCERTKFRLQNKICILKQGLASVCWQSHQPRPQFGRREEWYRHRVIITSKKLKLLLNAFLVAPRSQRPKGPQWDTAAPPPPPPVRPQLKVIKLFYCFPLGRITHADEQGTEDSCSQLVLCGKWNYSWLPLLEHTPPPTLRDSPPWLFM